MSAGTAADSPRKEAIMEALRQVEAPDMDADVVSLGMVRTVSDDDAVTITLVQPTPSYPHQQQLRDAVDRAVSAVVDGKAVSVSFDIEVRADQRVQAKLNLPIKTIVAVASGKGGVGKSTVAVNLAVALAQEGAAVGLLDADIYGPNVPMMMGVESMPPVQQNKLIPVEAHGVKFMSMGFLMPRDKALIWRGPMLHKAIQQLFTDVRWGALDYMIVDLPPGTGDAQLSLAQTAPLTGGLIVTMPQNVSLADARRAAAFEQLDVPILGVVENMAGEIFGSGGGQRAADELGVPFLGSVELEPAVRVGGDAGTPIVVAAPQTNAARSLRQLARKVALRVREANTAPGPEIRLI